MRKCKKYVIVPIIIILFIAALAIFVKYNGEKNKETRTLKEVKLELSDYKFSEHSNLTFNCDVPEINADKLYTITMNESTPPTDETETRLRKLMSLITPLDFTNIQAKTMKTTSGEPYSVVLNYNENRLAPYGELYEGDNTFVCRNINTNKDIDYGTPNKTVDINDTTAMNEEIELVNEGKMTISQADSYISETLKNIQDNGFFNDGESIVLKNALIEDIESSQVIVLRYEHILKGLPVDTSGFIDTYGENGEIRPSYIEATVSGKNEFMYLGNRYYYKPEKYTTVNKILPLSKAEEIVTEELAPNLKYEVKEVDLKYCCYTKDTDGEFTYRPMWYFLLDEQEGGDFANYFPEISAYVDAVSGDMYYCNSANMQLSINEYE